MRKKKKPLDLKPGEVAYIERGLFARRTKAGALRYGISFIDPEGRRVRETVGPSKNLARKVLSKRRTEIAEGRYEFHSRSPAPSVSEVCERYLEYARQHKRSWKRDAGVLARFREVFGTKSIDRITTAELSDYHQKSSWRSSKAAANRGSSNTGVGELAAP